MNTSTTPVQTNHAHGPLRWRAFFARSQKKQHPSRHSHGFLSHDVGNIRLPAGQHKAKGRRGATVLGLAAAARADELRGHPAGELLVERFDDGAPLLRLIDRLDLGSDAVDVQPGQRIDNCVLNVPVRRGLALLAMEEIPRVDAVEVARGGGLRR